MKKKRVVLVRYTLDVPVDVTGLDEDIIEFEIEENSCLATHDAGVSFDKHIEKHEKQNSCWACALNCKAEIIDYNYV